MATPAAPNRLVSLDALRGFDMFWIVGADAIGGAIGQFDGGSVTAYLARQLDHVAWEGFRPYDLIFPTFLFMAGVAIPFSLSKFVEAGNPGAALARIGRRVLLLVLAGIVYYGGLDKGLAGIRLLGVLQRIGICYGVASLCFLYVKPRLIPWVLAGVLLSYWALMALVPVPGFGAGDFAEGHNLANWLDSQWLPFRKWDGDHDPEGILSTLPAVGTCLLGMLAGQRLKKEGTPNGKTALELIAVGFALVALGWAWSPWFPVVKKLWTSSFVLVAGGWSLSLLGVFYYLVDVRKWTSWAQPFMWIGANSIALYFVSNVVDFNALSSRFVGGPVSATLDKAWAGLGGLVIALTGALLCTLLARFLYRRGVFIRI